MTARLHIASDNDPLDGRSLPGWVYHDPEFFQVEMDRVIRPSWQVVSQCR
jgi:carnitine monooxygenase subunit